VQASGSNILVKTRFSIFCLPSLNNASSICKSVQTIQIDLSKALRLYFYFKRPSGKADLKNLIQPSAPLDDFLTRYCEWRRNVDIAFEE